ncbi:hypothetical protein [Rhodococcus sp. BS-15]|uniref:hypothetical protein n=1 Tax=Rhodococcus sp. BS-15 TaxID=1304954 RepID=UPI000A5A1A4E|nr:hypothetical protein [Rhodococcus sp. BS-15]
MRVKIEYTIDIDIDAWAAEYNNGAYMSPAEVRADVKVHCEQMARSQLGSLGLDTI